MADEIFVSYSRRNQEFVRRLAADLDTRVAGVWFDQSDIAPGEHWRQAIEKGIRGCKAFILVISPDSMASREVLWELDIARKAGKRILPVIYQTTRMAPEIDRFLHEIQYIDLRRGSYTDNFELLVEGLIASGIRPRGEAPQRGFLREPVRIDRNVVLRRIPGWALAWGLGWGCFWLIVMTLLMLLSLGDDFDVTLLSASLVVSLVGALAGAVGGLLAGAVTMSALRRNAPSISWKHMKPAIGIWAVSGPIGLLVSFGLTALLINLGVIATSQPVPGCSGLDLQQCLGQMLTNALAAVAELVFLFCMFSLLFMVAAWFLTGLLAGRWAVRRIRLLEPGISAAQARKVAIGWGFGAVLAAIAMVVLLGLAAAISG